MEYKKFTPRETIQFNPPIRVKEDWMLTLVDLEVYNSMFNITEENNKFQVYTDPLDSEFSLTEMKLKIAELLGLSHITPEDLEHKTRGQHNIKAYRKLSIKESWWIIFSNNELYTIIISRP